MSGFSTEAAKEIVVGLKIKNWDNFRINIITQEAYA